MRPEKSGRRSNELAQMVTPDPLTLQALTDLQYNRLRKMGTTVRLITGYKAGAILEYIDALEVENERLRQVLKNGRTTNQIHG